MTDWKQVYTVEQYATEFSGATVEELREEYGGMTLAQIKDAINDIWPNEDNNDYLAECINLVANY